jgi:hypothetical protein
MGLGPWNDAGWLRVLLLLAIGVGVALVVERVSRRFLPLAALLQLCLVFPDRRPSRLLLVLRAGSVRSAERLLAAPGSDPEAADAAAHVLQLVAALNRHDRITRGHCERVRAYADLIARELDLSLEDTDRLRWVALLHDVGKLRVSAAILNKRGPLSDDEWDAIREHPTDGGALIRPMAAWLGDWHMAVAQHHERFDGRGYPNQLSGSEICLGARIIAVIDAFDVMTASRSYKRPISTKDARAELRRCAGAQFDPAVVDAFLSVSASKLPWLAGVTATLARARSLAATGRGSAQLPTAAGVVPTALGAASAVIALSLPPLVSPGVAAAAVGSRPVASISASPTSGSGGHDGPVTSTQPLRPSSAPATSPPSPPSAAAGSQTVPQREPAAPPGDVATTTTVATVGQAATGTVTKAAKTATAVVNEVGTTATGVVNQVGTTATGLVNGLDKTATGVVTGLLKVK